MEIMKKVRTRFAPSPTGSLHIGGLRTALFNYLFARKHGGDFILRLEDTDQKRLDPDSEDHIKKSLEWLGIDLDESPWRGGDYGPYVQSQREYKKYADQLVKDGYAYYAFDTPQELQTARDKWDKQDPRPCYNHLTRMSMNNSLSLSEENTDILLETVPYVVRWKWSSGSTTINDLAKGDVTYNHDTLDDKVIFKSDGLPTYHLANVVDDYTMKISHVIRGDEWLNSTPLHIGLYKALGWDLPVFVHCPLLLTPDGAKISKRNAHKYGLSVFVIDSMSDGNLIEGYKTMGYSSHPMLNFLYLLGHSNKKDGDSDSMSIDYMVDNFDLNKIGSAGVKVFKDKLDFLNFQYITDLFDSDIIAHSSYSSYFDSLSKDQTDTVVKACKDRSTFIKDIPQHARHFFDSPSYKDDFKKKVIDSNISIAKNWIDSNPDFSSTDTIKQSIYDTCVANDIKMGKLMPVLRYALTGGHDSPDLLSIMYVRGVDSVRDLINLI